MRSAVALSQGLIMLQKCQVACTLTPCWLSLLLDIVCVKKWAGGGGGGGVVYAARHVSQEALDSGVPVPLQKGHCL